MKRKSFELSCGVVMRRAVAVLGALLLGMIVSALIFAGVTEPLAEVPLVVFALGTMFWFVSMVTMPATVTVGDDGFCARYGMQKYYVPMSTVTGVARNAGNVQIQQKKGGIVHLNSESEVAMAFQAAANEALENWQRAQLPELVFQQQGRSFEAWRDAMRALVDRGRSSYRAMTLPRLTALANLTSARVDPELRVGAAFALSGEPTKEERDAVDTAMEGVASPSLRRAIQSAFNGEPSKTELALDALKEELRVDSLEHPPPEITKSRVEIRDEEEPPPSDEGSRRERK